MLQYLDWHLKSQWKFDKFKKQILNVNSQSLTLVWVFVKGFDISSNSGVFRSYNRII